MAPKRKDEVHPFIEKVEELYDIYCADPDTFIRVGDELGNMEKKSINFLESEYAKINGLLEDEIPSLCDILNLDVSTKIKKDLYEKFIIFIQVEQNTLEFFELRNILNMQIAKAKKSVELSPLVSLVADYRNGAMQTDNGYKTKLDNLKINDGNKAIISSKIEKLEEMSKTDGEYHKLKDYVRKITSVPFGKYANSEVTQEKVITAKKLLDKHVMFNYNAKDEILNYLINDGNHCISLFGPPGTSKSTLIQKGLSEALSRPMRVISLGGKKDASYLTGHSYTYEGAIAGRIVDILIETQVMNPIIYFDELDKMSGKAINGVLTHLIDPSQNFDFHDNYFSGISFDLSKVLFVFSYNDATELDLVVSDRIKHIEVKVLSASEKVCVLKEITIPTAIKKFFGDGELYVEETERPKKRRRRLVEKVLPIVIKTRAPVNVKFEDSCLMHIAKKYDNEGMRGLIKDIDHVVSRIKALYFLRDSDKSEIINLRYGKLELDFDEEVVITADMYKEYFEKEIADKYHSMYI